MEFKNLAKFYIDEHGRVDKTEDTSFIVSGSENETAIELLIANTPTTPTDIVVYASFKRADGFVISNRSLDFKGVTEDSKYYDFIYTFSNDRILDIAGQLEVSFTIKSGSKTINSVSNTLYVRKNVKPNLETTTEEEFYQEAIKIVEKAQQDINQHRIESEAKFNSKVDKTTYEKDMPTKVDKVSTANQVYITDDSGNQTSLPYSKNAKGGTIVQRNDDGRIDTQTPTEDQHATNKGYVDNAINQAVNPINKALENKVEKTTQNQSVYATDENSKSKIIKYSIVNNPNTIVLRDYEGAIDTSDPKYDNHAVNKKYADNTYLPQSKALTSSQPDTIPMRDSAGRINIGYPTSRSHGANKQYVDDQIKSLVNAQSGNLAFVYDTYEHFINSIEVADNKLVSVTAEDGTLYTADKIELGIDFLIRADFVPDYWLSRKTLTESEEVINLFTAYETKLDLNNYYTIPVIDEKLKFKMDNFKHLTGSDIESGTFENGEIIWCTASSDFFNANTYYLHNNGVFKPISTGSNISITPSISSFNVTISTEPSLEIGRSFNVLSFNGTLKKYADFAKLTFIVDGSTVGEITNITSSSFSKTELNKVITKNSATSVSANIKGYNANSVQIGYNSKTLVTYYARQYFGIAPDNPSLEIMTNALATNYYKNITANTDEIKTYLQSAKPSNITLNLSDTPTYVWFIIPTNLTISKMTSGGFDFPFIQQSNVTINNQYNIDIEYKVYRSANKIYGTTTINLS